MRSLSRVVRISPAALAAPLTPLAPLALVTIVTIVALVAAGCQSGPTPIHKEGLTRVRFARVSFRPEGKTLYSSNFLGQGTNVPPGGTARVSFYSEELIRVSINDYEYEMKPIVPSKFPTDEPGIDGLLAKYFVDRREDLNLDALGPAEHRDAMRAGTPRIGMTKEQVYACLGPPLRVGGKDLAVDLSYEKIMASDHWSYPKDWIVVVPTEVEFFFGDGRLQKQRP